MQLHSNTQVGPGRCIPARCLSLMVAVFLGFMISSAICWAATFNWPTTPAWAATGPTNGNTETVDYGYNAQGSLRVSVLNSGVTMTAGYPATAAAGAGNVTGGVSQASLQLATNTTSATTSYQQVTISFMYTGGASGVSFTLWDVDATSSGTVTNGFIDQISHISATTTTGTTIYPTVTGSPTYNTVAGSGAGITVTGINSAGNATNQGDVTISFTGQITSLTFQYANIAPGTRSTQYVGISPINFTPSGVAFPEVNSSSSALMLCGGVMGFGLLRRRSHNAERSLCKSDV